MYALLTGYVFGEWNLKCLGWDHERRLGMENKKGIPAEMSEV